ncbi:MAG: aminotransferase class I/II-fold pyridoxal phosphate-dependent enzyme [Chthoniobacterales bacterium]|jgi:histidinol-phosphate aminotransferase|nr:aminotransferase class I/II-fold pyridoxal phosphate-dependent enzyme [Chthoniobacterales bacterium]
MTISRRKFAQLLGAGAAATVARPALSFCKPAAAESPAQFAGSSIVRLSSNENPYGPSRQALKAMSDAFGLACRYPDEHTGVLVESLAKLNAVQPDQILLGDGSGEILKLCAEAFTGARGKLISADPTFEAIVKYAAAGGAEVVKVPLTSSYSHDLSRMMAAANGGLVYICNPNNPTASITPKDEIREIISKASPQTMILVDEAYFHYADSPDYESVIPLIKDHPNLIVARTFSKIYGMAGLRCGYGVAQKGAIERLRKYQAWDSVNIMALTAAIANLNDPDQVVDGRRLNSEARAFTIGELDRRGYKTIPSQANFIMVDVKRPVVPLINGLKQRKVEVGRLFPALPNHLRVTIGTKAEMEAFLSALREVTGSTAT